MNILCSISGTRPPTVAASPNEAMKSAARVAEAPPSVLNVTLSAMTDVDALSGSVELDSADFRQLDALFDKAFSFPPPPMPDVLKEP